MKLDQARHNENVCLRNILTQMKTADWWPDVVVGVARGGLYAAVVMSHALEVPMVPLVWSTRDYINKTDDIEALVSDYQRVLVIDDIADSGKTFEELFQVLEGGRPDVRYAAMYMRYTTSFVPDYFGMHINHDAWINFSWEIQAQELRN